MYLAGDGLCEEVAPEVFQGFDDGLFYVKEVNWPSIVDDGSGPQPSPIYKMAQGMATVPESILDRAIEAAEDCPGSCIFLEYDEA